MKVHIVFKNDKEQEYLNIKEEIQIIGDVIVLENEIGEKILISVTQMLTMEFTK